VRRTTIREVARRAGVSHQTVSRVINNSPEVSESTRALVQQAIAELDYHPNAQAVGLSRNRSDIVGVVAQSVTSSYFAQIVDGIAEALQCHGRFMLLTRTDSTTQQESINLLQRSRRIDGMIIILPLEASLEQARQLAKSRLPLVLVDLQYDLDAHYISVNNFHGAYSATEYLIKLGHRRIGLIGGREELPVAQTRLDGYQAALRYYGLPFDPTLIVPGDFMMPSGEASVARFLALEQPPTAVFATNDPMALGAIGALRQHRLNVPEDISVVGFDDTPEARNGLPPLTTIRQPLWDMGKCAADYVCRLIDEPELEPLQLTMATELIVRQSTAPPPSRVSVAARLIHQER
jgi:LacI family transcriptional regulator